PVTPPDVLYHGTATSRVDQILASGLSRMARHHVHLSGDVPTARKVGGRHGTPVVLVVDAAAMHRAGMTFYRSANGVWLTDSVPPDSRPRLRPHLTRSSPSHALPPPPPRRAHFQRRPRHPGQSGAPRPEDLHPHPGGAGAKRGRLPLHPRRPAAV